MLRVRKYVHFASFLTAVNFGVHNSGHRNLSNLGRTRVTGEKKCYMD